MQLFPSSRFFFVFTACLLSSFHTEVSGKMAGTCGNGYYGNGICAEDYSKCCSPWGWCGTTPGHCGPFGVGVETPEGTCGNGDRGNGKCGRSDICCSPWGWCGTSDLHCQRKSAGTCGMGDVGNGLCPNIKDCCLDDVGVCLRREDIFGEDTTECPPVLFNATCGGGKVGNALCKKANSCCSRNGYCGSSDDYCGPGNKATAKPPAANLRKKNDNDNI